MDPDFLESRQAKLQKYFNVLLEIDAAAHNRHLLRFLGCTSKTTNSASAAAAGDQSPGDHNHRHDDHDHHPPAGEATSQSQHPQQQHGGGGQTEAGLAEDSDVGLTPAAAFSAPHILEVAQRRMLDLALPGELSREDIAQRELHYAQLLETRSPSAATASAGVAGGSSTATGQPWQPQSVPLQLLPIPADCIAAVTHCANVPFSLVLADKVDSFLSAAPAVTSEEKKQVKACLEKLVWLTSPYRVIEDTVNLRVKFPPYDASLSSQSPA
eukprot:GHVU01026679.1.p1 GENE.GHVU01026679.1~~GHVU01026679.1.p1  ORF type:complete len:269 (+),score=62.14 GHVU01026679.1:403-1209(+)